MTGRLGDDGGYTLIELLVVMALLSVVVGGIVTLFASGLNSEADQNRRFQAQQDGRLALDKLRREVHWRLHDLDAEHLQHRPLVGHDLLPERQLRVPGATASPGARPAAPGATPSIASTRRAAPAQR